MRTRTILALVLLLLLLAGGRAAAAAAPSCPAPPGEGWSPVELFAHTADWPRGLSMRTAEPKEFAARPHTQGVAGRESLVLDLRGIPANAIFLAAARRRPRSRIAAPADYEPARAAVVARADGSVTLRLDAPRNRGNLFDERWLFAVAVCDPAGMLAGYGLVEVAVNPRNLSRLLAAGIMALIYLGAVSSAWRCNARRMQEHWARVAAVRGIDARARRRPHDVDSALAEAERAAWRQRILWKLTRALSPVFVSQDASGTGSLGRLQLLLFTFAVGFVALNIYFATGAIAELGEDVLWLLGISIAAAGASRLVPTNAGLSAGNRQWIAARRLLYPSLGRLPLWRDIISSDGEIDITRVQAVIFTLLTVLALVRNGAGDLSSFAVSDEVQYLLGLSQVAYIAGKAIPTESVKRLNDAITAIRAAEALPPATADRMTRFEDARTAAGEVLVEVYGVGFRAAAFEQLRPLVPLPALPGDAPAQGEA